MRFISSIIFFYSFTCYSQNYCDSLKGRYKEEDFSISYSNGYFSIVLGDRDVKLESSQNFTDCLDFSFRGIYINKPNNSWYVSNYVIFSDILIFNCLDDLGRSMLFAINLEEPQFLIKSMNSNIDFLPSRFNKYYFDEKSMIIVVCGEDVLNQQRSVSTNVYYNRIDSKGIHYLKKIVMSEIDHFTILASRSLF
jgi:hypothetical protein